jgi:modulator of FtsH protease
VFGGLSSWFSISIGAGFGSAIVSSIAAIAVIWFVLPRTQNSNMGILTAFATLIVAIFANVFIIYPLLLTV